MKKIVLAKRLHRIFAGLIDLIILLGTSALLFFTWIYPASFDYKTYSYNNEQIIAAFKESQLYVVTDSGEYCGKSRFASETVLSTFDQIYNSDLTYHGSTSTNNNLSRDLYLFYTTHYKDFGTTDNLSNDAFLETVFKIGDESSNFLAFDFETYVITLKDTTKEKESVKKFLSAYATASTFVEKSNRVQQYFSSNQQVLIKSVSMFIPVVAVVGLIFNLMIPLFSPHNETIGKYIFGLGVLTKDGYKLNKLWLIPRYLVYIVFEVVLGIVTFGGTFLISYTMFMFVRKRRCLHDVLSNSVVYQKAFTIYFDTPIEEACFKERYLKEHPEGL